MNWIEKIVTLLNFKKSRGNLIKLEVNNWYLKIWNCWFEKYRNWIFCAVDDEIREESGGA